MAKTNPKRKAKRPKDDNDPIGSLRKAWETGHSVVVMGLNTVLTHVGLSIKAPKLPVGVTLTQASERFWNAAAIVPIANQELAWLHRGDSDHVFLWAVGCVDALRDLQATGKETERRLRFVNRSQLPTLDADLQAIVGSLECRLAPGALPLPKAAWKRYIVDPVEKYAASRRKWFDELASASEVADNLVLASSVWKKRFRSLSEFKAFLKRNEHIKTKSRGRRLWVDAAAVIKTDDRERNVKLNAESEALDKAAADYDGIEQRKQAMHSQKVGADQHR